MRDRDVRLAIKDLLDATLAFDPDGVWLRGLPEVFGSVAPFVAAVAIDPDEWREDDRWDDEPDGAIEFSSQINMTFLYRAEDSVLRDEGAERLVNVARNALNGVSLAGLTLPAETRFTRGKWQKVVPPERRIIATFTYKYLVEGWDDSDTAL